MLALCAYIAYRSCMQYTLRNIPAVLVSAGGGVVVGGAAGGIVAYAEGTPILEGIGKGALIGGIVGLTGTWAADRATRPVRLFPSRGTAGGNRLLTVPRSRSVRRRRPDRRTPRNR